MSSVLDGAVDDASSDSVFAKRRERIVETAVRLFAERAYADVHMDAVAAAAGVAKPTLYRYFATKEALFIEALECALEELRHEIRGLRTGTGSVEGRFRSVVACVLDRVGRLTPAIRVVEGRSSDLGERSRIVLRRGFAALKDEIGALLGDGVDEGAFGRLDLDIAALAVLGGVRMAAHSGIRDRDVADAVADFFLTGLCDRSHRPAHEFRSNPGVSAS
jgi:TetR/AcrR family transcriptional regulator, mexJK operon transcriptional repressor